jgi:hypothetical protein
MEKLNLGGLDDSDDQCEIFAGENSEKIEDPTPGREGISPDSKTLKK